MQNFCPFVESIRQSGDLAATTTRKEALHGERCASCRSRHEVELALAAVARRLAHGTRPARLHLPAHHRHLLKLIHEWQVRLAQAAQRARGSQLPTDQRGAYRLAPVPIGYGTTVRIGGDADMPLGAALHATGEQKRRCRARSDAHTAWCLCGGGTRSAFHRLQSACSAACLALGTVCRVGTACYAAGTVPRARWGRVDAPVWLCAKT